MCVPVPGENEWVDSSSHRLCQVPGPAPCSDPDSSGSSDSTGREEGGSQHKKRRTAADDMDTTAAGEWGGRALNTET